MDWICHRDHRKVRTGQETSNTGGKVLDDDRRTLAGKAYEHINTGRHIRPVITLRRRLSFQKHANDSDPSMRALRGVGEYSTQGRDYADGEISHLFLFLLAHRVSFCKRHVVLWVVC